MLYARAGLRGSAPEEGLTRERDEQPQFVLLEPQAGVELDCSAVEGLLFGKWSVLQLSDGLACVRLAERYSPMHG